MKPAKIFCIILIIVSGLASCISGSKRKSAEYYTQNKEAINALRQLYDELYYHQPFSVGFTDRSYKYYVMEVLTDTLRMIYNTEQSEKQLYETISKFNYDTAKLKELSKRIKDVKCLWLSKSSFYVGEKKDTVTYFSFKSATIDKPFVENKYYILIFLNHPITNADIKERVKRGGLVRIDELVYFMIGNNYR